MDEISRTFIDGNGFGGMSGAGLGAGFIEFDKWQETIKKRF